jgi:hypothetical protein
VATLLVKLNHGDKSRTHDVLTLVHKSLLNEFIQGLDVLIVDDVGQDPEGVSFDHLGISHLDVFTQARNHDKNFLLVDLEFLDEDIDESAEVLVESRVSSK